MRLTESDLKLIKFMNETKSTLGGEQIENDR